MDISKKYFDHEMLKKYSPEVITAIGIVGVLVAAEANVKGRERLTKADSYMDASYELCTEEVVQNRGIFYRVKMFFKRLFRK